MLNDTDMDELCEKMANLSLQPPSAPSVVAAPAAAAPSPPIPVVWRVCPVCEKRHNPSQQPVCRN